MLKLNQGIDILQAVGGIDTIEAAAELFERTLHPAAAERLETIKNQDVLLKIANAIAMCEPSDVFVHTGSPEDIRYIRKMAVLNNEEFPLTVKDHTCHFDLPEDQGRMVDKTFYIANENEEVNAPTIIVLSFMMPRICAAMYSNASARRILFASAFTSSFSFAM